MVPIEPISVTELAAVLLAGRHSPFDESGLLYAIRRHRASGEDIADPITFASALIDAMLAIVDQSTRLYGAATLTPRGPEVGCYGGACDPPKFACSQDFGGGLRVVHHERGWTITPIGGLYATRPLAERAARKAAALDRLRTITEAESRAVAAAKPRRRSVEEKPR